MLRLCELKRCIHQFFQGTFWKQLDMRMEWQQTNVGYKTKGGCLFGVRFAIFTKNRFKSAIWYNLINVRKLTISNIWEKCFLLNNLILLSSRYILSLKRITKTANGRMKKITYWNHLLSIFFIILENKKAKILNGAMFRNNFFLWVPKVILEMPNSADKDGWIILIQRKLKVNGRLAKIECC